MRTRFFLRIRTTRASGDAGVALPMVLGTMLVLTLFLLTSLGVVLRNMAPARADQDSRAALAAAQAGIDEYIARLNATDGQYWTNGGVDATNAAFDTDPSTVTCDGPGRLVPGSTSTARFCYRVTTATTTTAKDGYIVIEVTGTSAPPGVGRVVTRKLTATLRPRGFIDFIYYTDVEVLDPVLLGNSERCGNYYYGANSSVSASSQTARRNVSGCTEIQWGPNDVVDGPLHSNDALQVGGAVTWKNTRTESSWPTDKGGNPSRLWWGSGTPSSTSKLPVYAPNVPLPDGNQELLKYVLPKVDTDPNTNRPGCLYTGATRIRFVGSTMRVYSPNTTNAPSQCLNTAQRNTEQVLPIPPVVYVRPAASSTCTSVGYPLTNYGSANRNEATDSNVSPYSPDYSPCNGTAFVQGNIDGQVTVSADDDIVVTGDLTVQDPQDTDIAGLVAGNYVWIYHPLYRSGSTYSNLLSSADAVNEIDAAILSLRHSILVQNWNRGADLGSLSVYGALAQKFRGPVGTTANTGYDKDYVYDTRLQVLQPPFFLSPENAPWHSVLVSDG